MEVITRILLAVILFAGMLLTPSQEAAAQQDTATQKRTAAKPKKPTKLYKPPFRGAPVSRVGGGIRGPGDNKPSLYVLAPDHTGFTLIEQPDLYWYISKAAEDPIEIIINDETRVEPMLEVRLKPPIEAGLHRIQLGKRGMRLMPGTTYEWFVSLVTDSEDPSQEVVAGGTIERAAPASPLKKSAEAAIQNAASADAKWRGYAASGIWYDAVATIVSHMNQRPTDKALRALFADLLDDVELSEPAAYFRQ